MNGARVVADVGGTNARFATVGATTHDLRCVETLRCTNYETIGDALDAYLHSQGIDACSEICLAVAGPVGEDMTDLPNNPWAFSRTALEHSLGAPVRVINDFTAQALCIDALRPADLMWFGTPRPGLPGVRIVLGPGTGLGVAVRTTRGEIIPSEGGHVAFAPVNEGEIDVLRALLSRYGRVSAERILSGPGLENLFWANLRLDQRGAPSDGESCSAEHISRLAAEGDGLALKTVRNFLDILATFAGDVALFAWSTGGVYLSGGVLRSLAAFLDTQRFRNRFADKGRFADFCETVPVAWIKHEFPGLLGCAVALEESCVREPQPSHEETP